MGNLDVNKDFPTVIVSLAKGFQAAEGWFAPLQNAMYPEGTKSYANHNPGNIFGSPFQLYQNAGYSVFLDDYHGFYALCHQLQKYLLGLMPNVPKTASLEDMCKEYTGLSDATGLLNYTKTVSVVSGVALDAVVGNLI